MPQTYTVKVVSDKEFSRLSKSDDRYSLVDRDNLGFADPERGVAYARYVAHPALQRWLVNHEFEHLLNPENGVDKDSNGIYHKRGLAHFGLQLARQVGPFLGIAGGIGGKAAQNVLKGRSPGYNLLPGAVEGGITTLGALGGGNPATIGLARAAGSAASDAMTGRPGLSGRALKTGLTTAGLATGVQGLSGGGFNPFSGGLGSASGAGQTLGTSAGGSPTAISTTGGSSAGAGSPGTSFLQRLFGGGGGPPSGPPPGFGYGGYRYSPDSPFPISGSGVPSVAPGGGGIFNQFGGLKGLGGFGLGGALSLLGGSLKQGRAPSVPELGQIPSIQTLRQGVGQPITDVARSATARLQERLAQTPESFLKAPEIQTITGDIQRQYDEARRNLYSQYQLYNPDTDLSNNTSFQRASRDLDRSQAAAIAQVQQQQLSEFRNRQTQDISTSLGVDTQTLGELMDLANLDVQSIMLRTGLKAQEAQDFRNTFSRLGAILANRAIGGSTAFSPFQTAGVAF